MAIFSKQAPSTLRADMSKLRTVPSGYRPGLLQPQTSTPLKFDRRFLALLPHESEDARLTGSTRSLNRRLLALNLRGTVTRIATYNTTRIA